METLQHRREHQSLIRLYRYLHNNGLKYIKDFFASEKLNVIYFILHWIFTLWNTIVRFVLQSVNLSMYKIKILYLRKCLNDFHSRVVMHQKNSLVRFFDAQSSVRDSIRFDNFVTSQHGDHFGNRRFSYPIRNVHCLFVLIAVCTNNSIGN